MERFLVKVARKLLQDHPRDLKDLCVILPTRRAGLYLKKALGINAGRPLIAPSICSIEDLVRELSTYRIIDHTEALMLLYSISGQDEQGQKEPFEEFARWAGVFLGDIQEIDRYLADAGQLFGNLSGIRELESWSLNREELTPFQKKYLEFWKSLHSLYTRFTSELSKQGLATEGMAMRAIAEDPVPYFDRHGSRMYYAAGFNALSAAEEKIFLALHRLKRIRMLWDGDVYYYSDPAQEAGRSLRKHVPDFAGSPGPLWLEDHLSTGKKSITITGTPSNTLQVKAAGEWIASKAVAEDEGHSALVLADENLLVPVLHSIPRSITAINVSMGYALRSASFTAFAESLLAMHERAQSFGRRSKEGPLFYHKDIDRLFRQPALLEISGDPGALLNLCSEISRRNRIFCGKEWLCRMLPGSLQALAGKLTADHSPEGLLELLEELSQMVLGIDEEGSEDDHRTLEKEFAGKWHSLFSMMKEYHAKYGIFTSVKTLRAFIKQSAGSVHLPFFGEPLRGLQVMGMLETRCLDFDRIAILSANEGILPSGRHQNTFIPLDLRRHFGLPTYQERDSIFAYHFYRMIQRASEVNCFYTTVKDTFGSGEKSRFLSQLLHELTDRNPGAKVEETLISPSGSIMAPEPVKMGKNGEVAEALENYLIQGLSPSALNRWFTCPLRFALTALAGIREDEETEESVDARMLGNAIHAALKELYKPFEGGKTVRAEDARKMRENALSLLNKEFLAMFPGEEKLSGRNYLALKAAAKYLDRFLEKEEAFINELGASGRELKILHIEKEFTLEEEAGGKKYRLKGICDRIDQAGEVVRIIDYKTGLVEKSELKAEDIQALKEGGRDKAVQLLTYATLTGLGGKLQSGIISFRSLDAGFMAVDTGREFLDKETLVGFMQMVGEAVSTMRDTGLSFFQTEDRERCRNCEFREICSR